MSVFRLLHAREILLAASERRNPKRETAVAVIRRLPGCRLMRIVAMSFATEGRRPDISGHQPARDKSAACKRVECALL